MKNTLKKLSALLLALSLVLGLSATALAANTAVTYGASRSFTFVPGANGLTTTDLFDNFKGAMPGDELTQTITVTNAYTGVAHVRIYMRAMEAHQDHGALAQSPDPNALEGNGIKTEMSSLLSQLRLRVWNGTNTSGTPIYDSDATPPGLEDWVLLGSYAPNQSSTLTAKLDIHIELGNEYMDALAYVCWDFMAEEIPADDDDPWPTPTPRPVFFGPRTGDGANTGLWIALLAGGVAVILLTALVGRKKRKGASRR